MGKKVTLSVIKADVGSYPGHVISPPELLEVCEQKMEEAQKKKVIEDYYVTRAGDDIQLIMTHYKGTDNKDIHKLAWDSFKAAADVAKKLKMYGAGQDLLKTAFSGNIKGMGPGVAEMEFKERENEAFVLITADKTEPGAFNFPFYRLFCEPSANTGLILNPSLSSGVIMNIMDVNTGKKAELKIPKDNFLIAAALMYPGRYVVDSVKNKYDEPILVATTDRLHNIMGTYVGKDDPAAIIRLQKNFPATEEACSVFKTVHYVAGNTRGSHHMPLMPIKRNTAATANYCIPIVGALLFSVHEGKFTGPVDAFETPDWDYFRNKAVKKAEYMREQGFVHPATLIPEELEYNKGYQAIMDEVKKKFK